MFWTIVIFALWWYLARRNARRRAAFARAFARGSRRPSDFDDYAILGCKQGDSDDTVKSAYRAAALKYHPDRLRMNGVSDELIAQATSKMARINAAWGRICKSRGLKSLAFCVAAFAALAMGSVAVVDGREWNLSPECRLEGNLLFVSVPKGESGGMHAARTIVDMSRFEREGYEAVIRVRGEDVSVPAQSYNGVKFMLHFRDKAGGGEKWPGASVPTGTFDWRMASIRRSDFTGAAGDKAELVLGLQNSSGTVCFDLSTLKFDVPRPHWPVTNLDHVAVYSQDVATLSRRRGVMSPTRNMTEDDFITLRSWGANLLRYQMMRNWHGVNTNRDLDEFGRWIDGRLDHFDKFVLPMACKYGIKVVLDFHVPPGGRAVTGDMNMFYEREYADNFVETWRQIARRFKGREGIYGYDLINEPSQRDATLPGMDYWSLQRRAAEAVRAEDSDTPIIIESNEWDGPSTFTYLSPLTLTNVIYQAHMYAPMDFTHQQVLGTRTERTVYPDANRGWDIDYLRNVLKPVRDFQLKHKARIYIGEFSAIAWAQGAERYLADCIKIFEEYGWDWSYHAFREWNGWSVEHEGENSASLRRSDDNPRKRALISGLRGGN